MSKRKPSKESAGAELDWFSFETRIRKLIQDLVDPIQKRALDAKEASDAQRKGNDSLKRKVEELEFAVHKSQKKSVIFEEINNRISKLEVGLKGAEQQLDEEMALMGAKIEHTKDQIRMSSDQQVEIEKKIDVTRSEIGSIHESLMKIKDHIINQVSSIDEAIHNELSNIRINLNSISEKHQTTNMRVLNHAEELNLHK